MTPFTLLRARKLSHRYIQQHMKKIVKTRQPFIIMLWNQPKLVAVPYDIMVKILEDLTCT